MLSFADNVSNPSLGLRVGLSPKNGKKKRVSRQMETQSVSTAHSLRVPRSEKPPFPAQTAGRPCLQRRPTRDWRRRRPLRGRHRRWATNRRHRPDHNVRCQPAPARQPRACRPNRTGGQLQGGHVDPNGQMRQHRVEKPNAFKSWVVLPQQVGGQLWGGGANEFGSNSPGL